MIKMSLLDMVQDILNDLDGDVVNSISDTEESYQVAQIIKTTYSSMMVLHDLPHLRKVTILENVSDPDKPNYLKLPERVSKLEYLAYNQKKVATDDDVFSEVRYLYPDEFLTKCNGRDVTNTDVTVVTDFGGTRLNILNNKAPDYWTSFDDEYIVFDAWPQEINTTLVGGQSQAILHMMPTWEMENTFIPDLPVELFPGLLAEAKSTAFYALRQSPNEKAEQMSRMHQRLAAQRGWKAHGGIRYPNYGRAGKSRARSPRFQRD